MGIRLGLDSAGDVKSDCGDTLEPATLNEAAGTDAQFEDLHSVVSDLAIDS